MGDEVKRKERGTAWIRNHHILHVRGLWVKDVLPNSILYNNSGRKNSTWGHTRFPRVLFEFKLLYGDDAHSLHMQINFFVSVSLNILLLSS
jgi:hypothetical protein